MSAPDPDAVMAMSVLMSSPNRDKPGVLLAAAEAYAALKSSRERTSGEAGERSDTQNASDLGGDR